MKKTKLKLRMLLILGMIALFPSSMMAGDPPLEEIVIIPEGDDPLEDQLDLFVYLNVTTGQIYVDTFVNQWIWVYIIDIDTNAIVIYDEIDPAYNYGNTYYTTAPTAPGNYCIYFCSNSAGAYGFFTIQ